MSFAPILGQEHAVGMLRRALASGRLAHAYRFEGPEGVGKERVAFALAQALVCERRTPEQSDGCGVCSACHRAITRSESAPQVPLHPDVILVGRALYSGDLIGRRTDEIKDISIEQIRHVIIDRLALSSHEGRGRLVIIRSAEELSTSAANSLLKTLEEPPQGTHFVLLTAAPGELLDTIRSRTLPVRFGPLPDDALSQILRAHHIDPALHAEAIRGAAGSASATLAAAHPEQVEERRAFIQGIMEAVTAPTLVPLFTFTQRVEKKRDDALEQLQALLVYLVEETKRAALEGLPSSEQERHVARVTVVQQTLRAIEGNAGIALAMESMILRMRDARPER